MFLQGDGTRNLPSLTARRRFIRALAASALLHFVVLWPASRQPVPMQLAQRLSATLRERAPIDDVGKHMDNADRRPVSEQRSAETSAPDPAQTGRKSRLAAIQPRNAVQPIVQNRTPTETGQPVMPSLPPRPATQTPSAIGGNAALTASSATGQPTDGVDANALRQYRFAVSRAAHPDYPSLAIERGWSGTAEVRVEIGSGGRLRGVALAHSSGHTLLDAQAQTIIGLAAENTALPEALRGSEFSIVLPVEFRLQERKDP